MVYPIYRVSQINYSIYAIKTEIVFELKKGLCLLIERLLRDSSEEVEDFCLEEDHRVAEKRYVKLCLSIWKF